MEYTMEYTREHRVEDQQLMCLIQNNFLTQHVPVSEPTRGTRILYVVLASQKEFVDKVKIQEPLGGKARDLYI